jgi:hypothetical protein
MEKTPVEWLEDKIQSNMSFMEVLGLIRQAKEMEAQQEIETWSSAYDQGFNNCKKKYKTNQQEQ